MTTPEINALKSRVGDLRRQLTEAEDRLREAEIAQCPAKIGDIVTYRGQEHRVTEIKPSWQKAWLMGNPRKKDGTFGIAERHLYGDWELVK